MNISAMLLMQSFEPAVDTTVTASAPAIDGDGGGSDPSPRGEEDEAVGDDEPETVPENQPAPIKPSPATPDANPIDPRVFEQRGQ